MLEGREFIMNTMPYLPWHLKGIGEKVQFWLEEHRKRVREYDKVPSHEELHKLRTSMKAR